MALPPKTSFMAKSKTGVPNQFEIRQREALDKMIRVYHDVDDLPVKEALYGGDPLQKPTKVFGGVKMVDKEEL